MVNTINVSKTAGSATGKAASGRANGGAARKTSKGGLTKGSQSDKVFGIVNGAFLTACLLVTMYPLYFVLIASFSDPTAVGAGILRFLPRGFTFDGYVNVFRNADIWLGYRNSIYYTFCGTLFSMALTVPAAYGLSKGKLPGRSGINIYFLFTMFFGGGLIPYFLLVRDLHLLNKPYTIIVLGGVSVFNVVVTRTFYQTSIPEELYDAAFIDGASEFRVFFMIALPLSAPIIAVMTLYYAVGYWNDFFTAMIFTNSKNYFPLQLVLRTILIENKTAASGISQSGTSVMSQEEIMDRARRAYMAETMKYSLIYIASAPMLILYPFVQKHFVKGVLIGSLKG